MRLTLVVLVALAAPVAASGTLDAGLVVVGIENGHHRDCVEDVTGLCLATASQDGLEDQEIDADQRLDWVYVLVNASSLEERFGVELLPDRAIVIDFREIYVRQPVFVIMTETLDGARAPGPLPLGFFGDEGGFGVWYPKLNRSDPTTPKEEPYGIGYGDGAWLTYDAVGPIGTFDARSTDQQWTALANITCVVSNGTACAPARAAEDAILASTPNVHAAASLHEAAVATNASLLGKGAGLQRAGAAGGSPGRSTTGGHVLPLWAGGPSELPALERGPAPDPRGPAEERPPAQDTRAPPRSTPPQVVTAPGTPSLVAVIATAALLAVAAAALYSRIRNAREALDSPRRARLLEVVRERGACTMRELCDALRLAWSPVEHHVRILQQHGLVVVERRDGAVLIRAPGSRVEATPAVALRGEAARALLALVQARPDGIPRSELHALAGGIPRRSRNHALGRLLELGWVEERAGRLVARGSD